jgi:hypothetical protein
MPLGIGNAIGIPFGGQSFNPSSIKNADGDRLLLQQLLTSQTPTIGGTIYDESSNKGTARPVQLGRAYLFDGTNDYVVTTVVPPTSGSIEVEFIKGASTNKFLIGARDSTDTRCLLGYDSLNKPIGGIGSVSGTTIIGTTTLVTGTKYKLKLEWNGTTVKLYVNDVEEYSGSQVGSVGTVRPIYFGTFNDAGTPSTAYAVDKVWGVKINNATTNIAFYKCDEGNGTISYDSSGSANHGTITNATLSTFHSTQDVYSYQNEVGYSKPSTVFIPRNEALPTQDVTGSALQYTGQVPYNATLEASNCIVLDGINDYVNLPDIGTVDTFEGYVKLVVDDQELFTTANTTATAITVVAGVLTAGASITISAVLVDGISKTVAEAGALLNDNAWHLLKITFASAVATTDLRFGTNSSAYGNISIAGWKFSNSTTTRAIYPLASGFGTVAYDSSGNGQHGDFVNAPTWSTQDNYHPNLVYGFSSFTHLSSPNYTYTVASAFNAYKIEVEAILPADITDASTNACLIDINTGNGAGELRFGAISGLVTGEVISFRAQDNNTLAYVTGITIAKGYHKFAVVWDGSQYQIYIDDVQQTTQTYSPNALVSCDGISVGNVAVVAGSPYVGGVRNVKIYGQSNVLKVNIGFTNSNNFNDTVGTAVNATATGGTTLRVPALNATTDLFNLALTNPAGAYHNGAETLIDFTGGVLSPRAVINSWETAWAFNTARTNPEFKRTLTKSSVDYRADRFLAYRETLSGTNLSKVEKYTLTKAI